MIEIRKGLAINAGEIRKIRVGLNKDYEWSLIICYKNGDTETLKMEDEGTALKKYKEVIKYDK